LNDPQFPIARLRRNPSRAIFLCAPVEKQGNQKRGNEILGIIPDFLFPKFIRLFPEKSDAATRYLIICSSGASGSAPSLSARS
jgi:hypothetical protein